MTLSSGPFAPGSAWVGWVVAALVVVAFWAVPIAATAALLPTRRRRRQHELKR